MYREIMLRNKSIFQISTLIYLSSISICNLLIDLPSYVKKKLYNLICKIWNNGKIPIEGSEEIICPIFKKGDPKNVSYKIYAILIYNKLRGLKQ
jgi:hypothetical protein